MLLWRPHTQSISTGELESGSRISDQKGEGGVCEGGGGVTLARHAQVVWLKRDSHLWCGWVRRGVYVDDFYGAYTSGELRLVGFEPWPIGFQARGGDP